MEWPVWLRQHGSSRGFSPPIESSISLYHPFPPSHRFPTPPSNPADLPSPPPQNRPLINQIPGLPEILSSLIYQSHPGLLGICLSGAGPTILALATENFDAIAAEIEKIFGQNGVEVDWELLSLYEEGSWVRELGEGEAGEWVKARE